MALPAGLPEFTLGWGVCNWITGNLAHPDGDLRGAPFKLTNEQVRFIVWFYAVDTDGEFLYRRAVLERPKGWGKSPFVAAIVAAELLGATHFSHWQSTDQHSRLIKSKTYHAGMKPIGRQNPQPLIQIAAISDAQVDNSYEPLMNMLILGSAERRYGLEVLKSKITTPEGYKVERVTASPRSREGRQTTFAIADESWLWIPAEGGPELMGVIMGNLAKKGGRLIETTNAHRPGEQSVAETSHEFALSILDGSGKGSGILFDSRRGVCEDIYDHDQFIAAVKHAYGDAVWIKPERLYQEVLDPQNSEWEMRRKYLNELHSGDTKWMPKETFLNCQSDVYLDAKHEKFALGFVGKSKECAALVAIRLTDLALFTLKEWRRPEGARSWEVDHFDVDKTVRKWLGRLHPGCLLLANPHNYQDIVGRWAVDHEDPEHEDSMVEEFWVRGKQKMALAVDRMEQAVITKRLTWNPRDTALLSAVDAAFREPISKDSPEHTIRKDKEFSTKYIITAQAAILALEAAELSIEKGALNERTDSYVYGW